MADMHITAKGQLCYPTGHKRNKYGEPLEKVEPGEQAYIEVDIIPLEPRRVEWVRHGNLRPYLSKG